MCISPEHQCQLQLWECRSCGRSWADGREGSSWSPSLAQSQSLELATASNLQNEWNLTRDFYSRTMWNYMEVQREGGRERGRERKRESELLPLVVISMASMRAVPLTAVLLLSSPPADRPAPSLAEPSDLWMSATPTPATPTAMLSMVCIIMSHTYNS